MESKTKDKQLLRTHLNKTIMSAHGVVGIIKGIRYRSESNVMFEQVCFLVAVNEDENLGHYLSYESIKNSDTFITKKEYRVKTKYYHSVISLEQLKLC